MRSSHFTRKTPEYRLSGNKKALNSVSSGLKILAKDANFIEISGDSTIKGASAFCVGCIWKSLGCKLKMVGCIS